MKKLILTLSLAIAFYFSSFAQWTNSTNIYNTNSGNVGIGTPSPGAKLDIWPAGSGAVIRGNAGVSFPVPAFELNGYNSNSSNGGFTISTNDGGTFSEKMRILSDGNFGIGTVSPASLLELKGSAPFLTINGTDNNQFKGINFATHGSVQANISSNIQIGELKIQSGTPGFGGYITYNLDGTEKMRIQANTGNVGIGTTSPNQKLEVAGNVAITGTNGLILNTSGGGAIDNQTGNLFLQKADGAGFIFRNTSPTYTEYIRISPSGNLLIGKTTQTNTAYKLDIAGKARVNEIVVNSDGADFVFEPDYKLPKLSEVKSYIEQNHHLPEIPSAQEMQKNGMSVGELNTKLLQKVEELTLYLIEKDKQLSEQQKNNQSQQSQINQLKEQVTTLIKAKK